MGWVQALRPYFSSPSPCGTGELPVSLCGLLLFNRYQQAEIVGCVRNAPYYLSNYKE